MEPLPTRLISASFDLLLQAKDMVRHDASSVFLAIERDNSYAASIRERSFMLAEETRLLSESLTEDSFKLRSVLPYNRDRESVSGTPYPPALATFASASSAADIRQSLKD
jgi:hypothetical protein